MSYKDMLVVLDAAADTAGRIHVAAALAKRFGAHLAGLYPIPNPDLPRRAGYADLAVLEPIYREWCERAFAQAENMRHIFEQAALQKGISAEWRALAEGEAADPVAHARCADLVILGQTNPDSEEAALMRPRPERVALASGRPVLVVPYAGQFEEVGRSVLIAWNSSREAARAVADALPLIETAATVSVLAIDPPPARDGDEGAHAADIGAHLAHHGVKAQIERTVSAGVPIGDVLLSRAADLGIDLLVMGAYGHSRAREMLLGGATRAILGSMTIPVLMSH